MAIWNGGCDGLGAIRRPVAARVNVRYWECRSSTPDREQPLNGRTQRAHCVPEFALKNGYGECFSRASALIIFTFCFLNFFARLAAPARCFLAFCFRRLAFSIWE